MLRQTIVSNIVEALQKISVENGFYSGAGSNVFEWQSKPLGEKQYPAIIVRDPSDAPTDKQTLKHVLRIEIDLAISKKTPIATAWDMREVSSDVLKVFGEYEKEAGYVCRYLGSEALLEHKDSVYGGVRLEIDVEYHTQRWEQ